MLAPSSINQRDDLINNNNALRSLADQSLLPRSNVNIETTGLEAVGTNIQNTSLTSSNAIPITFSMTKRELLTPSKGFKSMIKRLKNFGLSASAHGSTNANNAVNSSSDRIPLKIAQIGRDEKITINRLKESKLVIFGCPQDPFTNLEFDSIREYLKCGGSVLFLSNEGGEKAHNTNINYLLEEFGISVSNDCVTRTAYYKSFYHPKEAVVTNGVTNREVMFLAGKSASALEGVSKSTSLTFVYPFGATLNVQKPGITILSSGSVSYPLQRPIAAVYQASSTNSNGNNVSLSLQSLNNLNSPEISGQGKLMVIGSCQMFSDSYFDKEDNSLLWEALLKYLVLPGTTMNSIDAEDPEVADYIYLPDISNFSKQLKSCLMEPEEFPSSLNQAFDTALFSFDMSQYGRVLSLYHELKLKPGPLTLIEPQCETPLPALELAIFQPTFRSLEMPPLELFDLDDVFMAKEEQLAQLCNKCTDDDLDYFIRKGAEILNISSPEELQRSSASSILLNIVSQVVQWKKSEC